MDKMIFRRIREEELPQIIALQMTVFHGEQEIPEVDVIRFAEKDPVCWCAESDGRICGCAAAWEEDGEIHWGRFVIEPSLRGHGIGTRLARYTFDELFRGGVEKLYAEARDAAVKIICAVGGEAVGEPRPFYRGNVTPVVLEKNRYRC